MTEDEVETFDIAVSDVEAEELAALLGGIGYMVAEAMRSGAADRAQQWGQLQARMLRENAEAARYLILEDEAGQYAMGDLPDELLDELGIKQVDNHFYDAETYTEIDVE